MEAFARRQQNPPNNNPNHRARNAGSGTTTANPSTAAWFQGAPLSKLITIIVAVAYAVFEMGDLKGTSVVSLDWQAVLFEGQIYRLFLYPLTFASIAELVVGLGVLCPLMRRFEREMGTRKFASFLLFKTLPISTIIQCLLLELSDLSDTPPEPPTFTPGPYPHIGALLYLYHHYTPKQHPQLFGVLGFDFSEKALTYGFALQSITSNGWSSFLPAAVGYASGYLASSPFLGLVFGGSKGYWEVVPLPGFVLRLAAGVGRVLGLDILRYAPTTGVIGLTSGGGMRRGMQGAYGGGGNGQVLLPEGGGFGMIRRNPRGGGGGGRANGPGATGVPALPTDMGTAGGGDVPVAPTIGQFQAPLPPPVPEPEAIEQLTAMGFDREAVMTALQATDNNVGAAANRLLSGGS